MLEEYYIPARHVGRPAKLFRYSEGESIILLIHGFNSSEKIWLPPEGKEKTFSVAKHLSERDFSVWMLRFSDSLKADIKDLAFHDLKRSLELIERLESQKTSIIVAHSMGGIVVRYFLQKHGKKGCSEFLSAVVLLGVPNHGVAPFFFLKDSESMDAWVFQFMLMMENKSLVSFSNKVFFQMLDRSALMQELNSSDKLLHPDLTWYNAIGTKDIFVTRDSASFTEDELKRAGVKHYHEDEFLATHMDNAFQFLHGLYKPLLKNAFSKEEHRRIDKLLKKTVETLEYVVVPPIYRSKACFEWWYQGLFA